MKKITILLIIITLFSITSYSQISAITSSGKRVILNTDSTWKYADGSNITPEKPCIQFHTGNLTIKNNTDKDIYFYYHYNGIYGYDASLAKIKAKSSKTVSSLTTISPGKNQFKYAWKAALESQRNNIQISEMEGIENGEFVLNDCETTEVEVDN